MKTPDVAAAEAAGKRAEANAERSAMMLTLAKQLGDKTMIEQAQAIADQDRAAVVEALAELQFATIADYVERRIDTRLKDLDGKVIKSLRDQVKSVRHEMHDRLMERASDDEMGDMPRHEWNGTKLRFEESPGVWGPWVNLQGQRGQNGVGGGAISTKRLELDGGGAFDEGTTLDGGFASSDLASQPGIGGGGAGTVFDRRTFNGGRSI